ncbi:MAG: hypothetical protein OHK0029_34840 [Armatimonadaceae bacterium]
MSGKPKPPHYVGIDFGTSKCVTTWYNPKRDEAEVINDYETGDWQTPSVVYYPTEGAPVVGQMALNFLTDAEAVGEDTSRIVFSAKRNIARRMRYMFPPFPTPRDVATDIFRKLRRNLMEGHFHFPVTHAVITVPASYDRAQRDGIRQAALAAGFEQVVLVDEPTAAAIAYSREAYVAQNVRETSTSLPKLGDAFLVYDLGAGTFDLSVLRRKQGKLDSREKTFPYEVGLKPVGMAFGGDDIDRGLYRYFDRIAREQIGRPISFTEQYDSAFLMQCRRAKVNLGYLPTATVNALLKPGPDDTMLDNLIHLTRFQETIDQETFAAIIRPLLQTTLDPVEMLLERVRAAGLGNAEESFPLDNIILIGGSSKIPLVRELLEERFQIHIFSWMNQDRAVALGAAYVAFDVFGPGTQYIAAPPPVAARLVLEVPPLSPPPLDSESGEPYPLTIADAHHTLFTSDLERGAHIALNVPSGKARLTVQTGGFTTPQTVEWDAQENVLYRLSLPYDATGNRFRESVESLGVIAADTTSAPLPDAPSSLAQVDLSEDELPSHDVASTDLSTALRDVLHELHTYLRDAGVAGDAVDELGQLAASVDDPCVVAVVGRVKAGKSTFVNALLGEDLAPTGATETTATINRFTYGSGNPVRPVRCHWRTDDPGVFRVTEETTAFLESLQGNTPEVLARSRDIAYLEYRLDRPFLRRMTVVDTPGMGATVHEHETRLAGFLGLQQELADRNEAASRRLASEADAIVFVVGPVPRWSDRAFLEAFEETLYPGVGALNAVGVLAKVDENPELFARRAELSRKLTDRLPEKLNVVLPVSAALQRYLDRVERPWLEYVIRQIRAIEHDETVSPSCTLGFLLGTEERWNTEPDPDCPISPAERARLSEGLPWATFTLLARTIATHPNANPDEIEQRLREAAGFAPLVELIRQRFVERGDLLRGFRIAQRALDLLASIARNELPAREKARTAERYRNERFLHFVRRAAFPDSTQTVEGVRAELEMFLAQTLQAQRQEIPLAQTLLRHERRLSTILHALEDHHTDQDALNTLARSRAKAPQTFSPAEEAELNPLFGLYGRGLESRIVGAKPTAAYLSERMTYWATVARQGNHQSPRHQVAHAATQRYGILLDEVLRRDGRAAL